MQVLGYRTDNYCGKTLYSHGWATDKVPKNATAFHLYEDPNGADDGIWYNDPNGKVPLAFEIFSESKRDIGNYTYYVDVQVEVINLPSFIYRKEFVL